MVCVLDWSKPTPAPTNGDPIEKWKAPCKFCGLLHLAKNTPLYFIYGDGSTIVSKEWWDIPENQALMLNAGLEFVNLVEEPPIQQIGLVGGGVREKPRVGRDVILPTLRGKILQPVG